MVEKVEPALLAVQPLWLRDQSRVGCSHSLELVFYRSIAHRLEIILEGHLLGKVVVCTVVIFFLDYLILWGRLNVVSKLWEQSV